MAQSSDASAQRQGAFVKNAWYCAGWAEEVAEKLLSRKILGEPVLIFRDDCGVAQAIINLCSHKLAPLDLGRRVGGTIECGYHGLRFDGKGRCVFNPQDARRTPSAANIRSYPLIERDKILWIWMGDPSLANPALVPDCSYMIASDRRTIRGYFHLKGSYLLLLDNLMDLGHAYYLHQASAGGLSNADYEIAIEQDGNVIRDLRIARNLPGPGFLTRHLDGAVDDICDHWMDISWAPASVLRNWVAVAPAGSVPSGLERTTDNVIDQRGTHILTPETLSSTHYFCANSRNYLLEDPAIDQFWRDWQRKALYEEDAAMVEKIEAMREDAAALDMKPLPFLSSDASGVKVARILDRLLAEERNAGESA